MNKAEIIDGKVVNVVYVDPNDIPDWCINWITLPEFVGVDWSWDGDKFVPPLPDLTLLESDSRTRRNQLLAESDWTQVLDAPVDQAAWATYRQSLRDITAQAGFPATVVWPAAPNK